MAVCLGNKVQINIENTLKVCCFCFLICAVVVDDDDENVLMEETKEADTVSKILKV